MTENPRQLLLGIALDDQATLDNFYLPPGSPLNQLMALLRHQLMAGQEPFVYLWGSAGSGVTHLLQGACHQAMASGLSVQYLPLDELRDYPPAELLEGMEQMSLVCIDNLQAVAGEAQWEHALFHLFNRIRDQGNRLLVGANASPMRLPVQLPDLQSRLNWGVTWQLPALGDAEKLELLRFCARRRGMEVSEGAASYLLSRAPRDMAQLMTALEQLDSASLEAQRKLTVPFIKATLKL